VLKSKIKLDLGLYIISKDLLKGKRYVNTEVQTSAKINGPSAYIFFRKIYLAYPL
jgi:hypothetical protein